MNVSLRQTHGARPKSVDLRENCCIPFFCFRSNFRAITRLETLATQATSNDDYVVVKFYPMFKFHFPLFWGMVMYYNEYKTKGNII